LCQAIKKTNIGQLVSNCCQKCFKSAIPDNIQDLLVQVLLLGLWEVEGFTLDAPVSLKLFFCLNGLMEVHLSEPSFWVCLKMLDWHETFYWARLKECLCFLLLWALQHEKVITN